MPPKRKNPFTTISSGDRGNYRFEKRNIIEEPAIDFSNPSDVPPLVIERIQKKIEENVEHGKKLVFRALKKAKGFEKQKLVKRLKLARGKGEDSVVKKLELEFVVLKTEEVNLNSLTSDYISKSLSKSRSISSSFLFPSRLIAQKEPEKELDERGTAKRNLVARLYNSNPVKNEMAVVLENLRKTMGIIEENTKIGGKRQISEKRQIQVRDLESGRENSEDDEEQDQQTISELHSLSMRITAQNPQEVDESSKEEWGGISDVGVSDGSEIDRDSFTAGLGDRTRMLLDDKTNQDHLQRDSSGEWSGEEDDDEDYKQDIQVTSPPATKVNSELRSKPGLKPQLDISLGSKQKSHNKKPGPDPPTVSTFLPSLMSGYISGSDSDIDADYYHDKKRGPAEPRERKNRMGQQARRALWEKKFGKHANHVKREETEQGRRKIERRISQGKPGNQEKHDGARKGKSTEVEGPLHPSWEAARKAKEQQAKVQEAVMGKPIGKKIIFD